MKLAGVSDGVGGKAQKEALPPKREGLNGEEFLRCLRRHNRGRRLHRRLIAESHLPGLRSLHPDAGDVIRLAGIWISLCDHNHGIAKVDEPSCRRFRKYGRRGADAWRVELLEAEGFVGRLSRTRGNQNKFIENVR